MESGNINYKQKYLDLKMKYMESVDVAFRLGFEQGAMQAQKDQMAQQQQQQAEMGQPMHQIPGEAPNQNSELDQHIAKLEQMMSSGEPKEEMQKALDAIKSLRASDLQAFELKKSNQAITEISKALNKSEFKIGKQADHNLTPGAKSAIGMQHKIIEDVMQAWSEEENRAAKDITKVLDIEGLLKRD